MKRPLGFTLLEALVAGTLISLILATLASIIWPALRISARESVRAELMTQASLALNELQGDLVGATTESIVIIKPDEDTCYITVHQLQNVTPDGSPIYSDEATIYIWEKPVLRQVVHDPPTGTPFRPDETQLAPLLSNPNRRQFSDAVEVFDIVDADPATPTLELPLQLNMELEKQAQSNSIEKIVIERRLFLPKR